MWLRSEHLSRRLRGRLSTAIVAATKSTGRRVQAGAVRKSPAINNSSQRVHTASKCVFIYINTRILTTDFITFSRHVRRMS
jgi:hypothetical protein